MYFCFPIEFAIHIRYKNKRTTACLSRLCKPFEMSLKNNNILICEVLCVSIESFESLRKFDSSHFCLSKNIVVIPYFINVTFVKDYRCHRFCWIQSVAVTRRFYFKCLVITLNMLTTFYPNLPRSGIVCSLTSQYKSYGE